MNCDVAIIGGGPAAATVGTLLRKYNPEIDVAVFEREIFPREHVGESLLPRLMRILDEMGAWQKMEDANFAVKIGAKYRWGNTDNLWDFDFIPGETFQDIPRPSKYEGQRIHTAFQVDRSIYDKILLDHAKEQGVRVFEDVDVLSVNHTGDRIDSLTLSPRGPHGEAALGGETTVTARYYVDGSGSSGLLRRSMGVDTYAPTTLRNIAVWDYWQNAEWAEHIGIGGTRIQVLSLGWGWIWFIPLGPTRTSIGLVTPAEYLKKSGKKPEKLYLEALESEPNVTKLLTKATRENILKTTRDWNFIADRLVGENWFLTGDAAGFADPILSAGLTLAQTGAQRVANTVLELDRGELEPDWLKTDYDISQRSQIKSHMAFADYWYSANGRFTELKEYCSEIAKSSGLALDAESAFQWIGTGGFAHDIIGAASNAHVRVSGIRHNVDQMAGAPTQWSIEKFNVFRLDLEGAEEVFVGSHNKGRIRRIRCLKRGANLLPLHLAYGAMKLSMEHEHEFEPLMERFVFELKKSTVEQGHAATFWIGCETLEAMIAEGWAQPSLDPKGPMLRIVGTSKNFYYGWWNEGVGIMGIGPKTRSTVMMTIGQMEDALKGLPVHIEGMESELGFKSGV